MKGMRREWQKELKKLERAQRSIRAEALRSAEQLDLAVEALYKDRSHRLNVWGKQIDRMAKRERILRGRLAS